MAKKPLSSPYTPDKVDGLAKYVANTWFIHNARRQSKMNEWKELRNYIFATDTSTTSNKSIGWKNSTTLPKLCQIRDNLHSNYISALFPNDEWLKWEAYSLDSAASNKIQSIEAYMGNKTRTGGFRQVVSQLLYDYIDYGNAFALPIYESSTRPDLAGNPVTDFVGPRARRISPLDIVFDPTADSFRESWKIIRTMKSWGQLIEEAQDFPDQAYVADVMQRRKDLCSFASNYGVEEMEKEDGYQMDGFGSYQEYLGSGMVEVLEFYGDIFNKDTGEVDKGIVVTVIDRMFVLRKVPLPSWFGSAPIFHAGWRRRPDNLWAMGPLDNLVGMQYRIDHLENARADAFDLAIQPPLVIVGDVEDFDYAPGEEIHVDENGDVKELARNAQWVIQAENNIQALEQRMEMYAGAPREAMGIRTAGEKTAFEVQQLQNAAGRIFQEKITNFEVEILEPLLNSMLEIAVRNFDAPDVVRVIDDDLGVAIFQQITKEDITASGVIRPIGARHFAAQAQLLQNLQGITQSQLWQLVAPDVKRQSFTKLIEDILGLQRYDLFSPNAAIRDQQETQRQINSAQDQLNMEGSPEVSNLANMNG